MKVELQLVVLHADDDFLHELDFGRASDKLHAGAGLVGTFAHRLMLEGFVVHRDHEKVVKLELRHLRFCLLHGIAHELVFSELAQRVIFAQSHQLSEALPVLGHLGFDLSDSVPGL